MVLGLASVVLVVLASAGGSVRPVSETTIVRTPAPVPARTVTPSVTAPTPGKPPGPETVTPFELPGWLSVLWQAVVYVAVALLAAYLARALYRMLRQVELPVPDEDQAEDWERLKTDRLAEAVDAGLDTVGAGSATDAVIRCWVALEDAAASVGVARAAAETPAEFTVRVLGVGGISAPQLDRLAELYREARYSSHGSTEAARDQARAALTLLRDELAAVRAARAAARTEAAARATASASADAGGGGESR